MMTLRATLAMRRLFDKIPRLSDKHQFWFDGDRGRSKVLMTTFIWSDSDRYERATGTDGVTALTWIEPENGLQGSSATVSSVPAADLLN
jgi:hypothetical protein